MLITLLVIIGLSFLVLAHEAGHFLVAKLFGMKVEEFGFGFPPRLAARKWGETEYSINWLPFGGFVKIAGENDSADNTVDQVPAADRSRSFGVQAAWKRSFVILAGVAVNFIIGWLLLAFVLMRGTPPVVVVTGVEPGSPAEAAGVAEGDIIKNFTKVQDFIDYAKSQAGRPITLNINRNGQELEIQATPRTQVEEGQGALGVVLIDGGVPAQGFFRSFIIGFQEAARIAWLTLVGFGALLKSLFLQAKLVEGVVGPIGIFSVAQQTGQLGLIYLVQLVSLISINLAVINLIPFPALDGGRFLFILIEKIKGSPMPLRLESYINAFGFALLLLLMALLTFRDIFGRLF